MRVTQPLQAAVHEHPQIVRDVAVKQNLAAFPAGVTARRAQFSGVDFSYTGRYEKDAQQVPPSKTCSKGTVP